MVAPTLLMHGHRLWRGGLLSTRSVRECVGFADAEDVSAPTQRKTAPRSLCELETRVQNKNCKPLLNPYEP